MKEEEKIFKGILFSPGEDSLKKIKLKAHNLSADYNDTRENETKRRNEILNKLIGELGENSFIQGPIFFHYGKHTSIGKNFFANFNLTIQDDAPVEIGDDCNFGPNVTIVTPLHPLVPRERKSIKTSKGDKKALCYAKSVKIGNNCWICANVTICPGVTIGDNCVIGAGSVVTRDIEPDSLAAGVPCRILRKISEHDSLKYKPEILADNETEI